MQGPHQCAPTYSPKTEWPGLEAYHGRASCSSSILWKFSRSGTSIMEDSGVAARRIQTQSEGWKSSLTTDAIDFSEGMASIIILLAL